MPRSLLQLFLAFFAMKSGLNPDFNLISRREIAHMKKKQTKNTEKHLLSRLQTLSL